MNYNYLLYFSVLAQTEYDTTAAAQLGVSQPTLSSAIHNLENSLGGVTLFEKVGRNIRLADEAVVCTVDTAHAVLDLVDDGIGIAFVPNECVESRPGIRFIPLHNWHQALYMCILYDKWLDQPVWDFVEIVVKAFRKKN